MSYRSLVSIATPFLDHVDAKKYTAKVGRMAKFKTTIDQNRASAISNSIIANDPSLSGAICFILFMILTPFAVIRTIEDHRLTLRTPGTLVAPTGTTHSFAESFQETSPHKWTPNAAFIPMKHNPGSTIPADMADMPLVGHVF